MLPLLDHYHNITICQAISPESFGHSGKNTFKMKSKWHPAQTAHPLSVTCTNMNELGESLVLYDVTRKNIRVCYIFVTNLVAIVE